MSTRRSTGPSIWLPQGGESITESYVNLVPTSQGGTHVNGLRTGITDAIREFCEFRSLLPRGVKIAPDDVWDKVSYVLSVKMEDPQFSGQTKETPVLARNRCVCLRGRQGFVQSVVEPALPTSATSLRSWLYRVPRAASRAAKKVVRKKVTSGPALPGKLADCSSQDVAPH